MLDSLDDAAVHRWCGGGLAALRAHQHEIDNLNVYPVPDGDTGTNLVLTLASAQQALEELSGAADLDPGLPHPGLPDSGMAGSGLAGSGVSGSDVAGSGVSGAGVAGSGLAGSGVPDKGAAEPGQTPLARAMRRMARGALLGARGNSGVIVSQILRGMAEEFAVAVAVRGGELARALRSASEAAYAAVARPVEGTVLSVVAAAADAAGRVRSDDLLAVARAASRAASEALARTPQQLPVLARAGVVDAGGRGLCLLLDALVDALSADATTSPPPGPTAVLASGGSAAVLASGGSAAVLASGGSVASSGAAGDAASLQASGGSAASGGDVSLSHAAGAVQVSAASPTPGLGGDDYGHEVQYLLDAEPDAVAKLKERLDTLGDSLVVVGSGDGIWNVHVHVPVAQIGAAIEAGVEAGRPHRISVTPLDDHLSGHAHGDPTEAHGSPPPAGAGPAHSGTSQAGPSHGGPGQGGPGQGGPGQGGPGQGGPGQGGPGQGGPGQGGPGHGGPGHGGPGHGGPGHGGPGHGGPGHGGSTHARTGPPHTYTYTGPAPTGPPQTGTGPLPSLPDATTLDPDSRGAVVVAAGEGLTALFAAEGAIVLDRNPSIAETLDAIAATRAARVVLLPNDANTHAVANSAAREAAASGVRVSVVPTRSPVQALAALAVRDPERRFADDVIAMAEASGACRYGEVCTAQREALTVAGRCRPGELLGLVDGEVHVIGTDLSGVSRALVDRMLGGGGELVTLVLGADASPALEQALRDHMGQAWPFVELQCYAGGQPRYHLLVGVE